MIRVVPIDQHSAPPPTPATPANLVGAIAGIMSEVHVVAKNGLNKFHGYKYCKMEDLLKAVTPLLAKHGVVVFQSETGRAMFDDDNVIAIEYSFTVAHTSGESWQPIRQTGVSTCRNSKGGWDDKSLNKCHTAARKYFLLSLLQIPTSDLPDADDGANDRFYRFANVDHLAKRKVSQNYEPDGEKSADHGTVSAPVSQNYERGGENSPSDDAVDRDGEIQRVPDSSQIVRSEGSISNRAVAARDASLDADAVVRRAAVQLQRSFQRPAYVKEPPQRKLRRAFAKERRINSGYEAQIRAERIGERGGKFRQPLQTGEENKSLQNSPRYNERNPPPSIDDDIPGFLDRRPAR